MASELEGRGAWKKAGSFMRATRASVLAAGIMLAPAVAFPATVEKDTTVKIVLECKSGSIAKKLDKSLDPVDKVVMLYIACSTFVAGFLVGRGSRM